MAFPTDTFTGATGDLDVLIPEIWGEKINDFYKEDLTMADFFTNRSEELAGGGDTLYTPGRTEMTANAKVNGAAVTLNSPTETSITLVVDQWFEVSFAIEDRESAQVKRSYTIQEGYAKNAGYTIAETLEIAISALAAGFSTVINDNVSAVVDADIRGAISALESNRVKTGRDVAFFVHPAVFWGQLQAIDKFSTFIQTGSANPVEKTPSGMLYNIPVFITTNITDNGVGYDNFLAHKDAVHFATASLTGRGMVGKHGVRVQSNYIPEYLSTVTTADLLYGVVENRDDSAILILSQKAAV